MPNEAEGSLDKKTNSLESAAQVLPQKSGPYDLTKSEAASTMPISKLWKYYSKVKNRTFDSSIKNMHKIVNYYDIDVLHYQELIVKENVINDYKEVTSIAYILLFNSHYYTIKIKIFNLLNAKV